MCFKTAREPRVFGRCGRTNSLGEFMKAIEHSWMQLVRAIQVKSFAQGAGCDLEARMRPRTTGSHHL
jgi:hypothetical protein